LKVLLNLVLIAGDALVRGGSLDVGAEKHDHGLDIVVRAEGSRIVLDPELRRVLVGEMSEDEVVPRAAAAWLAQSLVEEGGGTIQVADNEDGILIIGTSLPA
jgi:histidine phosphotransferase ChpT